MVESDKPTLHISKAVIRDGVKYLLLLRSKDSVHYPNLWDFAGGKDDPGETHAQSVIRETREETSFDIDPRKEWKSITYEDTAHILIFHYFHPKVTGGELTLNNAHTEFGWFTKKEIAELPVHASVSEYFG